MRRLLAKWFIRCVWIGRYESESVGIDFKFDCFHISGKNAGIIHFYPENKKSSHSKVMNKNIVNKHHKMLNIATHFL